MKHFLQKSSLALLCFLILSPCVKGQGEENWQLVAENNGVAMYFQLEEYGGQKVAAIKILNNNAYSVRMDAQVEVILSNTSLLNSNFSLHFNAK